MAKVIFRVKEKTPRSWFLKTRNAFGKREVNGSIVDKEIGYFPGKDSPFVEDNKDVRQGNVPEFEFRDETGHTELLVEESNKSLIKYLETHPWFGSKYEKYDSNQEARKKLDLFDKTEKALDFLKGKSDSEITALGLLIIGAHSVNMGDVNVLKQLKETAFSNPQAILDVTNNVDFKTLLIGATAFVKEIVTTNDTKTAVIWKDNNGVIVRVAAGENPIEKLSTFLISDTEESRTTLQEMGNRIGQNFADADLPAQDDKDATIAELKAKLEALQSQGNEPNQTTRDEVKTDETGTDDAADDIESLREAYFKKHGKEVAPVKKNDAEWIKSKLVD